MPLGSRIDRIPTRSEEIQALHEEINSLPKMYRRQLFYDLIIDYPSLSSDVTPEHLAFHTLYFVLKKNNEVLDFAI